MHEAASGLQFEAKRIRRVIPVGFLGKPELKIGACTSFEVDSLLHLQTFREEKRTNALMNFQRLLDERVLFHYKCLN